MSARFAFSLCAFSLIATTALAYEVDTHAMLSSHAFDRSVLATNELRERLGIDRFDDAAPFTVPNYITYSGARAGYLDFRQIDWDSSFSTTNRRDVQEYDWRNMFSKPGETFRTSAGEQARLKAWLMRGAIREDDLRADDYDDAPVPDADPYGEFVRVFHHFYDPEHDRALATPVPCSALPSGNGTCTKSPEWAFGVPNIATTGGGASDANRRNHFTWADAREAQWCALTRNFGLPTPISNAPQNAADRRLCWATMLKSLGHVLHLAQDLGQPQHVRNDRHNPPSALVFFPPFATLPPRRTYELWTNYRSLLGIEVSVAESERPYFQSLFAQQTFTPINVGLTYPIPAFSRPVHYFTSRQVETGTDASSLRARRGLADFTMRTFFSEGTILSPDFTLPPSDPASTEFQIQDRTLAADPAVGGLVERTLTGVLVDPVRGAYVDAPLAAHNGRVPLASLGMWADFDTNSVLEAYRSISLEQYAVHADVLAPRAIAYSAGLLNHFFRGKLEITAPLDGLFSVIDQATPHTVSAAGYPTRTDTGNVFGFTKLRLRVSNVTPTVNESGTSPAVPVQRDVQSTVTPGGAGVPTMHAVARYHRNPCYRPNLSGERRVDFAGTVSEPTGCADGTRTPFQEISVSLAVASSAAQTNGSGQDLVFDFSQQPIPVNATDLVVQVVYRGPLGLEEDAIAVGSFDVREPTHITMWNNTDYAGCSGNWAAHGATPAGCITEGSGAQRAVNTTRICIGSQLVYEHLEGTHGSLLVGDYVRLAALLDGTTKATRSRSIVLNLSTIQIRNRTITGQVRQSNKELPTAASPYTSEPFWIKRGYVGSFRPLPYYQINGADPQPASDAGPLDVGALTNPITVPPAPDPGNIIFPDVAAPNSVCN